MPKKDNKILKYNHGEKCMKVPFIIHADLEFLLEKISTCNDNPKKSSTAKTDKHTASGYSLFTHCFFDVTKSKLVCLFVCLLDCMKKICKDFKNDAAEIINYQKIK